MSRSDKWIPVIDEDACTGCGLCVEACAPSCLSIFDEIAILLCAQACGSEEHCVAVCPDDAVHMPWMPMPGDTQLGIWKTSDEAMAE
jgi:MinD superfamily P-loop ATPase